MTFPYITLIKCAEAKIDKDKWQVMPETGARWQKLIKQQWIKMMGQVTWVLEYKGVLRVFESHRHTVHLNWARNPETRKLSTTMEEDGGMRKWICFWKRTLDKILKLWVLSLYLVLYSLFLFIRGFGLPNWGQEGTFGFFTSFSILIPSALQCG